ncbi:MAG TPA: hypothetical protein VF352_00875 [Anaerolineales bacterium]
MMVKSDCCSFLVLLDFDAPGNSSQGWLEWSGTFTRLSHHQVIFLGNIALWHQSG